MPGLQAQQVPCSSGPPVGTPGEWSRPCRSPASFPLPAVCGGSLPVGSPALLWKPRAVSSAGPLGSAGTFRPWPQSFSPWDLGLCSLDLCLTAVWAPFPSQGAVSRAIPDQELRETVLTRDHGAPSPQLLRVPGPGGHAPIPRGPSPKQWTQGTEAGPGGGDLDSCTACWWWRRPLLWAGRLTATQGCSGGSAGGAHVEGSQSEAVSLAP